MLGKRVKVTVDRPLGTYHPAHKDLYYPINYGYIEGIIAPDGEAQDAYILGVDKPVSEFEGIVIAIIHRLNDVEDKWVVAPEGSVYTKAEIKTAVNFQEQFFDFEIIHHNDKAFLLHSYGEEYGPDAGPWNTSVKSKYLEYMIAKFFEENFTVGNGSNICNIGIGAGSWDRYLSYKLKGGQLTSIDIDEACCRQLNLRLINEKNPNSVKVIHSDILLVDGLENGFDIVTMVGSTRLESGLFEEILRKAISLVKPGGAFYYQTLDKAEEKACFEDICKANNMRTDGYLFDTEYGFKAQYFKAVKYDA